MSNAPHQSLARLDRAAGIDPITFSVILSRFNAIVQEMTVALERSAWTSVLGLVHDYSCGIYDASSRQVSMFDALPIHTTSMHLVVTEMLRAFEGDIHDGDVFLCNDPYSGNTHIGDLVTATPVFAEAKLVFWSVTKGHQLDTGAPVPSSVIPRAQNVWQEGLTIPPIRLVESGRMRTDLLRLYLANVRYAELLEGDLLAQIGSIEKGRQRLVELCHEYGAEVVLGYVDAIIDYADRRMSQQMSEMPAGRYTGEGWVDSDGFDVEHIPIRVAVTIEGDQAIVDYTGSAAQVRGGVNGSKATAMAAGAIPFLYYIDPDIPHNHGCITHIKVIAPDGTICNARYPASTSVATIVPSDVMQDVVNKALVRAMPDRVPAGSTRNSNTPIVSGEQDGAAWGFALLNSGGGGGASHGNDGWPLYYNQAALGGMKILPVEQLELLYPLRIERAEVEMDSMGCGRWIGGSGTHVVVRPLSSDMTVISCGDGCSNPPYGAFGGTPGIGGGQYVEDRQTGRRVYVSACASIVVRPSEVWVGVSTGGGGFGLPCERDVEAVRRDVRDGFISHRQARETFGVALSKDPDPVLYPAQTNDRRRQLRTLARPMVDPDTPNAAHWLGEHMREGDVYLLNPVV